MSESCVEYARVCTYVCVCMCELLTCVSTVHISTRLGTKTHPARSTRLSVDVVTFLDALAPRSLLSSTSLGGCHSSCTCEPLHSHARIHTCTQYTKRPDTNMHTYIHTHTHTHTHTMTHPHPFIMTIQFMISHRYNMHSASK